MKAKSILPWIFVLASVSAAIFFRASHQKAEAELTRLRAEVKALSPLREEIAELKRLEFLEPEVERLKKENAEVHKLRNEVRYLKEESKQLAGQVQKQQAQQVQQAQRLQATGAFEDPSEIQKLRDEIDMLRATIAQLQPDTTPVEEKLEEYKNACLENLRQISGAVQQWALQNQKAIGDIPEYEALLSYLPTPPACPQGGSYTIAGVGKEPTCNMATHKP